MSNFIYNNVASVYGDINDPKQDDVTITKVDIGRLHINELIIDRDIFSIVWKNGKNECFMCFDDGMFSNSTVKCSYYCDGWHLSNNTTVDLISIDEQIHKTKYRVTVSCAKTYYIDVIMSRGVPILVDDANNMICPVTSWS